MRSARRGAADALEVVVVVAYVAQDALLEVAQLFRHLHVDDAALERVRKLTTRKTFPQIFINGEGIGGFDGGLATGGKKPKISST